MAFALCEETLLPSGPRLVRSNNKRTQPEASFVERGRTVACPAMSGAGITGNPADKGALISSRTRIQTTTQFSSTTPTAGATAAKRPPRHAFADLVLKSTIDSSKKWGALSFGSVVITFECWKSDHLDLVYKQHKKAPAICLSQTFSPSEARILCRARSSTTVRGDACFCGPEVGCLAAPRHLLDSKSVVPGTRKTQHMLKKSNRLHNRCKPRLRSSSIPLLVEKCIKIRL